MPNAAFNGAFAPGWQTQLPALNALSAVTQAPAAMPPTLSLPSITNGYAPSPMLDMNNIAMAGYRPSATSAAAVGVNPAAGTAAAAGVDPIHVGATKLGANMATANLALSGIQTIGGLWSAIQQAKLAKASFNYTKGVTETNLANQIRSYNTALADRSRSRGAVEGQSQATQDAYVANNSATRYKG